MAGLIALGWFWGHKGGTVSPYDPYNELKDYNPTPEPVTRSTFEKLFPNGDEIFDWLRKNDYFYEKAGPAHRGR